MAPLTTCRLQQCQPSSPLRLPQPAFSAGARRVQREKPVQRALFAEDSHSLPRLRLPPALVLDVLDFSGPAIGVTPTSSARFPAVPGAVEAWLSEMGGRSAGCKALEALQTAQEHAAASTTTTASLPPPAFVLMGLLN